jgi:dolichol-phosphate mannosyltransferase
VTANATPAVSVIIPTRNEEHNVDELVRRLGRALGAAAEILFVDDSADGTPDRVRAAAAWSLTPIRLICRPPGERTGGLGGAVVAGLRAATAPWAVVMDGDLQHPPEVIGRMLDAATPGVDVVVASRHRGDSGGPAGPVRRAVSSGATVLTRAAFPRTLRHCTDPMSAFFAVRLDAVPLDELRPAGCEVLLQTLVRSASLTVAEVPFAFAPRFAGTSEASLAQGLTFVRQLLRLRPGSWGGRAAGFGVIGLTGVVPNLLATTGLVHAHVPYLLAAVLATQLAILWNFALADTLLFARRRSGRRLDRCARFVLVNNSDLVLRVPLMYVLVSLLGMHYVPGTAVSLVAAFASRFVLTDRWIYRPVPAAPALPQPVTEGAA